VKKGNDRQTSYPRIPLRNWWQLRQALKRTWPTKVDASYLMPVLHVEQKATANILPQLRAVGLIDESGVPTDLAGEWRDDASYAEACGKIMEAVYPQALRDALPPPAPDAAQARAWFSREVRVGESAANMMATFYLLLCRADLKEASAPTNGRRRAKGKRKGTGGARKGPAAPVSEVGALAQGVATPAPGQERLEPSLHIDVQIHIDSNASSGQIDQIFASMAKHLYKE